MTPESSNAMRIRESSTELLLRHIATDHDQPGNGKGRYLHRAADWLRSHYHPRLQHRDFRIHGLTDDCDRANRQKLDRWARADVKARPALDAWEPLVMALSPTTRTAYLTEALARVGCLPVPLPMALDLAGSAGLGDLLREVGEAVTHAAALYADGRINAQDDPQHLAATLAQMRDVQTAAARIIAECQQALAAQQQDSAPGLRVVGGAA